MKLNEALSTWKCKESMLVVVGVKNISVIIFNTVIMAMNIGTMNLK